jgi:sec-independent protein translocase protein TatB
MFDIGFQELIIIFVVALLVIGPDKLPEFSRKLGRWVNEIKRSINEAKARMEDEIEDQVKMAEDTIKSGAEEVKTEGNISGAGMKEGEL